MGMKANGGFFKGTSGNPVVGDVSFMGPKRKFLNYISRRKDIDVNGFFDIVGHGTSQYIQLDINDKTYDINWRVTAKIIKILKVIMDKVLDYYHVILVHLKMDLHKI